MRSHYHYSSENHFVKRRGKEVLACDPSGGLATMAIVTTIAGGAVSAYGASQQAKSQSDAYRYSASLLDTQSALTRRTADINSRLTQDAAARESQRLAEKTSETIGAQKVAIATNIGGGSVTAEDILKDTMKKAKLDQMAVQYNANLRSWGIRNEAESEAWRLGVERDQYLKAAKNARKAGAINVASSILNTATSVSSALMKYRSGYSPKLYNE